MTFASQLAKDAGKLIKEALDSRMQGSSANVEVKKSNPSDLVTETDKAVEEFIKEKLFSTYPEHKFIGEETFASGVDTEFTNEPTWIVDPIGKLIKKNNLHLHTFVSNIYPFHE